MVSFKNRTSVVSVILVLKAQQISQNMNMYEQYHADLYSSPSSKYASIYEQVASSSVTIMIISNSKFCKVMTNRNFSSVKTAVTS